MLNHAQDGDFARPAGRVQHVGLLALRTPEAGDYLYLVDDPAGTPADNYVEVGSLTAVAGVTHLDAGPSATDTTIKGDNSTMGQGLVLDNCSDYDIRARISGATVAWT